MVKAQAQPGSCRPSPLARYSGDDDNDDQEDKDDEENFDDADDLDDIPENMDTDAKTRDGGNGSGGDRTPRNNLSQNRNIKTVLLGQTEIEIDNQTPELIAHLYESVENKDEDSAKVLRWEQFLESRPAQDMENEDKLRRALELCEEDIDM
jgi:hypothetical protein